VSLDRFLSASPRDERGALAQLRDECLHPLAARPERLGVAIHVRGEERHRRVSLPLARPGRLRETDETVADESEER